MFKFNSNYILGALVVFAYTSIASAAPSELEPRRADAVSITACLDTWYDDCTTISVSGCTGLGSYNKQISSAQIPGGSRCTFFRDSGCPGHDSITLGGGNYPDFGNYQFDNAASSVSC